MMICPKCSRKGKVKVREIYGHKYYYFKHYGSEKPKEHYLGKEKPKFNENNERQSSPIFDAFRKLLKIS